MYKCTAGSSRSLDNQIVRDLAVVYTCQRVSVSVHIAKDQAEPLHHTCCKNSCINQTNCTLKYQMCACTVEQIFLNKSLYVTISSHEMHTPTIISITNNISTSNIKSILKDFHLVS